MIMEERLVTIMATTTWVICLFVTLKVWFLQENINNTMASVISIVPIIFFVAFLVSESIFVSSILSISCFFALTYLVSEEKYEKCNNFEGERKINVIITLHEIEEHIREDLLFATVVGLLFSMLSGVPLILFSFENIRRSLGELTSSGVLLESIFYSVFPNLMIHVVITIILIHVFVIVLNIKDSDYTDIRIKDEVLKWNYGGKLKKIKISDIKKVEENRFSVLIETERKKIKIWTLESSKLNKAVLANQI